MIFTEGPQMFLQITLQSAIFSQRAPQLFHTSTASRPLHRVHCTENATSCITRVWYNLNCILAQIILMSRIVTRRSSGVVAVLIIASEIQIVYSLAALYALEVTRPALT